MCHLCIHCHEGLTCVQQHVSTKHPLVCSGKTAVRAAMGLFVGMQAAHMFGELHRVEGREVAEGAAQLLSAWVALALVPAVGMFIGAGEVALGAVEGCMHAEVGLHLILRLE